MRRTNNGKPFYVVQFIELPFEGIDEYVCVPYSWVPRKATDTKVVVTYPSNESPLITRERVKKKERPDEEWQFYIAHLKHESYTYKDAEHWIASREHDRPCEKEETRDTHPEPVMNRKLRSASQPLFSSLKSDKPLLTVKPYKNPRKPLPRITIRLPLDPKLNVNTKRYAVVSSANSYCTVLNPASIVSDYTKRKQSIIINKNQLIQNAPTKIAADSNDKSSSEYTQPEIIKEDEPVMSNQPALPKKQPSPASQDDEHALSIPVINVDDDDDHVLPDPLMEERLSWSKTPPNTPERATQSDPVNEKSNALVHHEHLLPELRRQEVDAGQSKEPDESQRTQLHQLLTAPLTIPRLPRPRSTPSQLTQSKQTQLMLPVNSSTYPNPQLEGTNGGSSTNVTYNQQRPCSPDFIDSTLAYDAKPTNLSSSVTENLAVKKLRLENIARKMQKSSSLITQQKLGNSVIVQTQNHLQASRNYARSDTGASGVNQCTSLPSMATSAAQNLSNLAHQFRFPVELSHERQRFHTHEDYLQQNVRLNNMFRQSNIGHTVAHLQPALMNRGFTMPSKLNSTSQPNQFFPHYNNQYVPFNRDYMQDVARHETLRDVSEGAHTYLKPSIQNVGVNIQFSAQKSPNQLHYNVSRSTKYQDLHNHPFKTNSPKTGLQGVIKTTQSRSLPMTSNQQLLYAQRNYLLQDPRIQARLNQNPTEHQIIDLADPGSIAVEPEPIRQVFEAQTTPLVDQSDDKRSALLTEGILYQNRRKVMVDQATETDRAMDVEHYEDEIIEKSAPGKVDSACQTDEDAMEEQGSSYQATDSESADEVALDDACVDKTYGDMVSEANHLTEDRPAAPEQQVQRRLDTEQEMLDLIGTLFEEMGSNFRQTRDMFSNLRNGIIKCTETYEILLEKVENFNKVQVQISTPSPSNVKSGATEQKISGNDKEKNVKGAPKIKHSLRNAFILPPEYDPNDSKWTRKHREKKRGLVELMPRSNVYVDKKGLKKCKKESKDSRTFARKLVEEVFSRNALSVCSLTGGKAKAFNSVNIDIRPGLDEHARMVLLAFVEEYAAKRRWRPTETTTIISSIRNKILEMRTKFGTVGKGKP